MEDLGLIDAGRFGAALDAFLGRASESRARQLLFEVHGRPVVQGAHELGGLQVPDTWVVVGERGGPEMDQAAGTGLVEPAGNTEERGAADS